MYVTEPLLHTAACSHAVLLTVACFVINRGACIYALPNGSAREGVCVSAKREGVAWKRGLRGDQGDQGQVTK